MTLRAVSDWALPAVRPLAPLALALLLLIGATAAPGCATKKAERRLQPPQVTVAPYAPAVGVPGGEVLWAVAPLRNESGTTFVQPDQVTDAVIAAASEVRGVRVLPLNRTIAAMRALRMSSVDTPGQARMLARALGADAIVVGTITAWNPYNPPAIGLNLALMGLADTGDAFDPRTLVESPTDHGAVGSTLDDDRPMALVSEHLDARNHQVLADVRAYATGRHDPRDAKGWEVYLVSMPLYTRFATAYCVDQLVQQEWVRLAQESRPTAMGQ